MEAALMTSKPTNVQETLSFGIETYLMKQRPVAIGLLVLGGIVLAIVRSDPVLDKTALAAGLILVVGSLAYITYAHYRAALPGKPVLVLSPSGIRTRMGVRKEYSIPWNEIHGVETIDTSALPLSWILSSRHTVTFRDVTVVLVSRRFYDKHVHVRSWLMRGPYWSCFFVPTGDSVQIAIMHEHVSVPPQDMRAAIEQRWCAFSNHPNARLPPKPHVFGSTSRLLPDGWTIPPAVKRLALLCAALFAAVAIYFHDWGATYLLHPDIPEGSGGVYLRDLLDKESVHARLGDGRMVRLRRADVTETGPVQCVREIIRDTSAGTTASPVYRAHSYCTAALKHITGTTARAVFKLESKTITERTFSDKERTYKAIVPVPIAIEEAERRLCLLGWCAAK